MKLVNTIFKPNIKKLQDKKDVVGLIRILFKYTNYKYSEEMAVKRNAYRALIEIGEPSVQSLIKELNTKDRTSKIIEILGEIRSPLAIEPLEKYMMDHLDQGYWPDRKVYKALKSCRWKPKDVDFEIRCKIVSGETDGLASKYGVLALYPLINALEDKGHFIHKTYKILYYRKNKFFSYRGDFCRQLAEIGDERAFDALITLGDEDAIRALAKFGHKAILPLIEILMKYPPSSSVIYERKEIFKLFSDFEYVLDFESIYKQKQMQAKSENTVHISKKEFELQKEKLKTWGWFHALGLDGVDHRVGGFEDLMELYESGVIRGEHICEKCKNLSVIPVKSRKDVGYDGNQITLYSLCLNCGDHLHTIAFPGG